MTIEDDTNCASAKKCGGDLNTMGWTATEWREFHNFESREDSWNALLCLLESQKVEDPAWISLTSLPELRDQWQIQFARSNRSELPLFGVPVAVKDNIDVIHFQTTAACPSFAYEPSCDATVVKLLKAAGAIVIGKTNLDQFATGLVGTRSPYGQTPCVFNKDYVSGGSSAGSASVVARGIVPIALGTDTAGSGRVPAALNNIIGLKPSRGIFSCSGVVPACKSLDCVSVFALNLNDAELCLKIMSKLDSENDEYSRKFPVDATTKFPASLNVAIPKELFWFEDTENSIIFENSIETLKKLNANVTELDFNLLLELARCLYEGPWVAERLAATKEFLNSNPPLDSFDPTVYSIIKGAEKLSATDVFQYEYKRKRILNKIDKLLENIDVLCVPTCPLNPTFKQVEDEPILVNSRQGTWTNFVNLADMAAIAVPGGFRNDGLPNGVTFISRKFTDYALLHLSQKFLREMNGGQELLAYGLNTRNSLDTTPDLAGFFPGTEGTITVAVVGAHLKGCALHWQLEKVQAIFLKSALTSNKYELFALPQSGPVLKPGLRRINDTSGNNIMLELYQIPITNFGTFMALIPEPLGIGSVELHDGTWVKSFICEEVGYKQKGSVNITSYGGYKPYIDTLKTSKEKDNSKLFKCVLVANRGEIAVRIMKTLKKLNIKCVAIYSDVDKYSEHVSMADIKIALNGSSASDTYLNMQKVIDAAKASKAEAIIPGYGFLSENADFADACENNGIVFVGPSGSVIRQLGLKHSAKELAAQAKIPLVPGSSLISSFEEVAEFAVKIGYPVMIKSTAGGGGIGLQKVSDASEIKLAFDTVQHQGQSYFGNPGVFIEKYIESARHVEIQIMGDGLGNAIALGERDCSLQRRNQKVIEETPAPNVPEYIKLEMREAAERLAKLLKYKAAATVEYIYDEINQKFYFLEVNTRLQVEHPITEMVTGLDLVEWMIKICSDCPPDFNADKLETNGHSIEARLYAEDPTKQFRPSPGKILEATFPSWARVDTWIKAGTNISTEYDPTLAKIIVHGKDRKAAINKMIDALDQTKVYGCVTNLGYLKKICESEMFKEVKLATNVLDSFAYSPNSIEILSPGSHTTIQDYPGRVGYWRIGVPPSGPMDDYSFRLANRIVGNTEGITAIEATLVGPKILFHSDTVIAITGGIVRCTVNAIEVEQFKALRINSGDTLEVGKITKGCRIYISVKNGFDVPHYLNSKSTFSLGGFGGFNGRPLKFGDLLPICDAASDAGTNEIMASGNLHVIKANIPSDGFWNIGVTLGPHGAPDVFTNKFVKEFISSPWKVHYNSNRFGIKLIGPRPEWARENGGEGGLHPSNAHDYVYSLGAINFTGDEPVIITCDGPSLGGFVCLAVIPEAELWKLGQVKPGDSINFNVLSIEECVRLKQQQSKKLDGLIEYENYAIDDTVTKTQLQSAILETLTVGDISTLKVTYRQSGDRYILIEYGENMLNFNVNYRIHCLSKLIDETKVYGITELCPGIRSLLIHFDNDKIDQKDLLATLTSLEKSLTYIQEWKISSKVIYLPLAFEDSKTIKCVKRYEETIRTSAPWLPNNVDFVAKVNSIERSDVRNMMYEANFMVLGLGDVYLGSPCAVPIDPRHRFLGSKYNPARTFTNQGLVGLGGMYMCIYAADSPGGYQLTGRTIPIWDTLMSNKNFDKPWLLELFDQVKFYEVSEQDLEALVESFENGKFEVKFENVTFDNVEYNEWLLKNEKSIELHKLKQNGNLIKEFTELIKSSNESFKYQAELTVNINEEYPEGSHIIYSEFCGRFWKNVVSCGDVIESGQTLVILEAMKTEMQIVSKVSGKIEELLVSNGQIINTGDPIAVVMPLN